MAEIIKWGKNVLVYPHVVCIECRGDEFHIRTTDDDLFYSIICANCANEIFCNLSPVFGPGDTEK